MHAAFKHFVSTTQSWETMFANAAEFMTSLGPERVIGVSHSHGGGTDMIGMGGTGVVTVWYWTGDSEPE
jgi:hypothetical protein